MPLDWPAMLADHAAEDYCYLTTNGRTTGKPREIEIWFGLKGATLYLLSGSGEDAAGPKAHWVRNLLKTPSVAVRIASESYQGNARPVAPATDEETLARRLLLARYQPGYASSLESWGRSAIPVAIDLDVTT